MSDAQRPADFPLNPDYGKGTYRRRIRLQGLPGKVIAELEDCNHGFRAEVCHDGQLVTAIHAEALRIPLNTCGGATNPIQAMVGQSIYSTPVDIVGRVNPRANCTHLYDLTALAVIHCARGPVTRIYDVAVDDEVDEQAISSVSLNGEEIHRWTTSQWTILEPASYVGKPLYKGFSLWANEAFNGDEQEAAFILQKGYFVSQARFFDMDGMAGTPAGDQASMLGVCYSYSPEVVDKAFRSANSTRDFSDTPEQLLKFL